MLTLCIRYEIDHHKLRDFETYARDLAQPIRRCGGELTGYFLPTRFAGKTTEALALIGFPDLGAYELYRAALTRDEGASRRFLKPVRAHRRPETGGRRDGRARLRQCPDGRVLAPGRAPAGPPGCSSAEG